MEDADNFSSLEDDSRAEQSARTELAVLLRIYDSFTSTVQEDRPLNKFLDFALGHIEQQQEPLYILRAEVSQLFDAHFLQGLLDQIYSSYTRYYLKFREFNNYEYSYVGSLKLKDREYILNNYKTPVRCVLEEIFAAKDATNIVLKVLKMWPPKCALVLRLLVEVYEDHKSISGNELFFNKDILDILYSALLQLNSESVTHSPRLGHTLKYLTSILLRLDNYRKHESFDDSMACINNGKMRLTYIELIISRWNCADITSMSANSKKKKQQLNNDQCKAVLLKYILANLFKIMKSANYHKQLELLQILNSLYDHHINTFLKSEDLMCIVLEIMDFGLMHVSLLPLDGVLQLVNKNCFINYLFCNLIYLRKKGYDEDKVLSHVDKHKTVIIHRLGKILPGLLDRAKYCITIASKSKVHYKGLQDNLNKGGSSMNQYDCKQTSFSYEEYSQKVLIIYKKYENILTKLPYYGEIIWNNIKRKYNNQIENQKYSNNQ